MPEFTDHIEMPQAEDARTTEPSGATRYRVLERESPEGSWAAFGVAFESRDEVLLWYPPIRGPIPCRCTDVDSLSSDDFPDIAHTTYRWSPVAEECSLPFLPRAILKKHPGGEPLVKASKEEYTGKGAGTPPATPEGKVAEEKPTMNIAQPPQPTVFETRDIQYCGEKRCIAEYVAWWLRTKYFSDAIAIDGGTTNNRIVSAICRDAHRGLPSVGKIITNNVKALVTLNDTLRDRAHPQAEATGGTLRASRWTLHGPGAVNTLEAALFTVAVVGANGFDAPILSTTTFQEHDVKQTMIGRAPHIVFPIDADKLGRRRGSALPHIDVLAKAGKHVYLVTAYPIPEPNEDDEAYGDRKEHFKQHTSGLIKMWLDKFGDEGLRAICSFIRLPADPISASGEEISKSYAIEGEKRLRDVDFFRIYVDNIPWDRETDGGLAIAFELWDPKAVAGS